MNLSQKSGLESSEFRKSSDPMKRLAGRGHPGLYGYALNQKAMVQVKEEVVMDEDGMGKG